MEISDVRRRVRQVIEQARLDAAARRTRHDEAGRDFETFLKVTATPVFRMVANSLTAEKYPAHVSTPAGALRLTLDASAEDFIELGLDTSGETPVVVGRVNRGRGRRVIRTERAVREDRGVSGLTADDVLDFLMTEIRPFVER
jgi:hypothetical protein